MKKLFLLLFFLINSDAIGFEKGSGSEFVFRDAANGVSHLSIYISESSFSKLGVEYYLKSGKGPLGFRIWQQYIFRLNSKGPLTIEKGYLKTLELGKPQILESRYLNMNKGVQVNDFLFSKRSEIEKFKVGTETVEVPAGSVIATHYRKSKNGQIVDFWISDKLKPIGLVKLVSKSKSVKSNNYTIELRALLKNVKAEIFSKDAVPMNKEGHTFFNQKLPLK